MRNSLILLTLVFLTSFAQAETIYCHSQANQQSEDLSGTHSYGTGFTDSIVAKCISNSDRGNKDGWTNPAVIEILGKGLSLYFTGIDAFKLNCPNRTLTELKGKKLFGIKTSASIVALGADAGLFYDNADACILYGAQLGLGASLVGATLQF